MKQKVWVFVTLCMLLGLCSCRQHTYPSVLLQADSLTMTHPDSAVALLANIEEGMNKETEATRMYYRLLCIKAKDKAYLPHRSDSAILSVLPYYIEKEDHKHLPEAYYYAGRVYRDFGDAPQALEYFTKAAEVSSPQTDQALRSRIYSQMGNLFVYQNMYEEALPMFQRSFQDKTVLKDTMGLIYSLSDIAKCFRQQNQNDSALIYYKQAHQFALQIEDDEMAAMESGQLAGLYTSLKQYDSAKQALHRALSNCHPADRQNIYAIAARFYYQTGQMDSVAYFYRQLIDFDNVYAKYTASKGLAAITLNNNVHLADPKVLFLSHTFA